MSQDVRDMIANSANFFWNDPCEKEDIRDPNRTQTYLISILQELHDKGWYIKFTSVRCDHSDDSSLGKHGHAGGFAVDCWPLASPHATNYLDASDPRFQTFLRDVAKAQYLHQIGLAGSAWTEKNIAACEGEAFHDDGADHIHIGATEP